MAGLVIVINGQIGKRYLIAIKWQTSERGYKDLSPHTPKWNQIQSSPT